jgi:putative transposase
MEKVYRTLVLKYDLLRLPPEEAEKVSMLLRVQEEFRRWTTVWAKSGGKEPLPERPLKYFARGFLHGDNALERLREIKKNGIKIRSMRAPLIFNAQLRLNNERDRGRGVLVDMPRREVRIRKLGGGTIVLPFAEPTTKWILERVREGGKLVMAAVWVGRNRRESAMRLHVALTFRREVTPMEAKRLLVIDFNALHHGISWAVVEGERVLKKGVLRPDVSKILHLQRIVAKLEPICAERGEKCDEVMAMKSRIWQILHEWENKVVRELVWTARKRKAAIVVDVPDDKSMRELKEGGYVSEKKVFLNFGRLRRRLQGLAEWYAVPFREERLYSTVCPRCNAKMEELPNRRVKCKCGFEAHRDEVPALWAMRRFRELTTSSFFFLLRRPTRHGAGRGSVGFGLNAVRAAFAAYRPRGASAHTAKSPRPPLGGFLDADRGIKEKPDRGLAPCQAFLTHAL